MTMRPLILLAAIATALSTPASAAPARKPAGSAWTTQFSVTPQGGHLNGNPQAEQKIVEYMSYTCPHCAHFEAESAVPLRMGPIGTGKVSFEVRHLLRDGLDLTVAMLTNCATPAQFFPLHHRFLTEQDQWIATAQHLSEAQQKRTEGQPMAVRLRALASDLKFYDIVAKHGITRTQADACLGNEALFKRLVAQTETAQKSGANSTPSFFLNGQLLEAHDWQGLQTQLAGALK
jgi:protein-disulfide isomerase